MPFNEETKKCSTIVRHSRFTLLKKLHLQWQVSFWLLSLCQKSTCTVVTIPSDMKTQQQHTRIHISTTLPFSLMNTTPAAHMGLF